MWFAVRKILPETIFLTSFDLFDMLTCQFEDQISQADSQWGIGALEPSRKLGAMRPPCELELDLRQAGATKPVSRAGWEWYESSLEQQRAAWTECTCAGARISIFLSFSVARVSPTLPLCLYAVRLGAMLLSPHVAVGPSEMQRAGAGALFGKLGGASVGHLRMVRHWLV